MVEKVINDARVYTDVQGLEQLRYQSRSDIGSAKKEVAKQFEAILMQIMLRSMREANQALASDLFSSDQMSFYQDLYDKQLTMNNGMGLASIIEKNIDQVYFPNQTQTEDDTTPKPLTFNPKQSSSPWVPSHDEQRQLEKKIEPVAVAAVQPTQDPITNVKPNQAATFNTPEEFIQKLWASAKSAGRMLGADPKVLLAQAALETNWGKKVLPHGDHSSFNLFNIKADASWKKNSTTMDTIEQKNGVLVKEKSNFRSYRSYIDSFMDYVKFLKENNRYTQAVVKAANPNEFTQELQNAGFATDVNYAEKIMKIFGSDMFKKLTDKLE